MDEALQTFNFTILIVDSKRSEICIEDRLFEAGCDDVLMCTVDDNIYLEFEREALSIQMAIQGALKEIKAAGCKDVKIEFNKENTIL